jgi:hypothetical protein
VRLKSPGSDFRMSWMEEPDAGLSELPELARWESFELGRRLLCFKPIACHDTASTSPALARFPRDCRRGSGVRRIAKGGLYPVARRYMESTTRGTCRHGSVVSAICVRSFRASGALDVLDHMDVRPDL